MPHGKDDLFALISDVENYPKFIKYIGSVRLLRAHDDGAVRKARAEVRVRYKYIRETFITDVKFYKEDGRVEVKLVSGPFRALHTHWALYPLGDGSTLVEFKITYELAIPFLARMLKDRQSKAADVIMNAFEGRAADLYTKIDMDNSASIDKEITLLQNAGKHGQSG